MSSALNILTNEPIIPFKRVKEEKDLRKVQLIAKIARPGFGAGYDKRIVEVHAAVDADVETLTHHTVHLILIMIVRNWNMKLMTKTI